jgi:hypothetical protein
MRATVDAFEQNAIDHAAESRDVIDNLDLPLVAQFRRVLVNTIPTLYDIRTASLISGDHPHPGNVLRIRRIIEDSSEFDGMGGIHTDDPNPNSLT